MASGSKGVPQNTEPSKPQSKSSRNKSRKQLGGRNNFGDEF